MVDRAKAVRVTYGILVLIGAGNCQRIGQMQCEDPDIDMFDLCSDKGGTGSAAW
jgi:hypothetical protein